MGKTKKRRRNWLLRHNSQWGSQLAARNNHNPILRNLEDNAEVRANVNRGTIEALQRRGLIAVAKEGGVMKPTIWRLASKAEVRNDTGRT